MNILIIPSFIQTKDDPTLGSFMMEQAIALQQAGNTVYMLFCDTFSIKYFHRYLQYREEAQSTFCGVTIFRKRRFCPAKHDSGFYGTREAFTRGILELYETYLSHVKLDVIHAHCCIWAGYAARALSRRTGVPYVVTEHSSLYGLGAEKIRGHYKQAVQDAYGDAAKVICVSAALQEQIRPYCERSVELGNIIDCQRFRLSEPRDAEKPVTFLAVCSLNSKKRLWVKGMDLLLDAFCAVTARYPQAQLRIGGGGLGVEILKEWVTERGLENNVVLLGALSRQEVAEEMMGCDIFVLPSRFETFGVVYAEAMSCGKPVIATRTGGPDSLIDESCGILVDVGDLDQLTRAMLDMAQNFRSYDSAAIRTGIVDNLSMQAIAGKLMELYAALPR